MTERPAWTAPINSVEIHRRFRHVPPDARRVRLHAQVRHKVILLGETLALLLPEGREKSLAITALEECLMRANQAIALGVPDEIVDLPPHPDDERMRAEDRER